MSSFTTNKKSKNEKSILVLGLIYFFNMAFTTFLLALTFGLSYFLIKKLCPFKKLKDSADELLSFSMRLSLASQIWLSKAKIKDIPKLTSRDKKDEKGEGLLFMANHRSNLDTYILLAKIPGLRVLAKKSLFSIPFLGSLMRASGQIPIDIKDVDSIKKALENVQKNLKKGHPVLIYPELTRCPENFIGLQKLSQFPFDFAFKESFAISPIRLSHTDLYWAKGKLPTSNFSLDERKPINIQFLSPIRSRDYSSAQELRNSFKNEFNNEVNIEANKEVNKNDY